MSRTLSWSWVTFSRLKFDKSRPFSQLFISSRVTAITRLWTQLPKSTFYKAVTRTLSLTWTSIISDGASPWEVDAADSSGLTFLGLPLLGFLYLKTEGSTGEGGLANTSPSIPSEAAVKLILTPPWSSRTVKVSSEKEYTLKTKPSGLFRLIHIKNTWTRYLASPEGSSMAFRLTPMWKVTFLLAFLFFSSVWLLNKLSWIFLANSAVWK